MVISSSHIYSKRNLDVVKTNPANKINVKNFSQNGQIQIYQSSYRGSYTSVIRDSLRNAALGRKVLLIQFMNTLFSVNFKLLNPFLSKITLYAVSLDSNYTACRKNLNNGY